MTTAADRGARARRPRRRVSSRWPSNSRPRVLGGEDEQRPPGIARGRCRRPWPTGADGSGRPGSRSPAAPTQRDERRAAARRGVGHDPVRDAAPPRAPRSPRPPRRSARPRGRGRRRGRAAAPRTPARAARQVGRSRVMGAMVGSAAARRRRVLRCRMGLLDGKNGAHLRRRQRPLDRVGHRPGAPRRRAPRSASRRSRA